MFPEPAEKNATIPQPLRGKLGALSLNANMWIMNDGQVSIISSCIQNACLRLLQAGPDEHLQVGAWMNRGASHACVYKKACPDYYIVSCERKKVFWIWLTCAAGRIIKEEILTAWWWELKSVTSFVPPNEMASFVRCPQALSTTSLRAYVCIVARSAGVTWADEISQAKTVA